jgi:hypothetical protein
MAFGNVVGETIEDLGQFHGTHSGRGGDSGRQLSYQFGTPPGRLTLTQGTQSCIAHSDGHSLVDLMQPRDTAGHPVHELIRLITQR